MKVSQTILQKLANDADFRLNTALALKVSERTIKDYVKCESDNLTKYAAVLYYKKCGFTEEQIFPDLAA